MMNLTSITNLFLRPFRHHYPAAQPMSAREREFADILMPQEIVPVRPGTPIDVFGGTHDQSLVVLTRMTEATDLLGVSLYETRLYQHYLCAVHGEVLPEGLDEDDLEQMRQWTQSQVLPERFRQSLVEFLITTDNLEDELSLLSQHRWERLRAWSNGHD